MINEFGGVSIAIFPFNKESEKEESKGWCEESINWYDNEDAVKILMNERKRDSDEIRYKEGVAVFCREDLDRIILRQNILEKLKYERDQVEGNDYHGNLLLSKEMESPGKILIRNWIVGCLEEILTHDANT